MLYAYFFNTETHHLVLPRDLVVKASDLVVLEKTRRISFPETST